MDALKLRSTGFKYINQLRPQTQKIQRERRNTKLRDLIVSRLLKSISQAQLKHHRFQEISKGSKSSRGISREKAKEPAMRIQNDYALKMLDKDFEEIARLEVDSFLSQGKILTDK